MWAESLRDRLGDLTGDAALVLIEIDGVIHSVHGADERHGNIVLIPGPAVSTDTSSTDAKGDG